MLKRMAVLLALLLPSAGAFAFMDLSAFGGYTTLSMGDVNSSLNAVKNFGNGTTTNMTSGFYVGAEGGFTLIPVLLKVGPRIEYVQGSQASFSGSGFNGTLNADDLLLELGVSTGIELPGTGLWFKGGLYGGYGMAGSSVYEYSGSSNQTDYATGNGFVGEANVQIDYKIAMGLSLGLDLGYRYALVSNMNVSSVSGSSTGILPAVGKPILTTNDVSGGPADNFDFSGLNIGAALTWSL